jgi:hypothetical protein
MIGDRCEHPGTHVPRPAPVRINVWHHNAQIRLRRGTRIGEIAALIEEELVPFPGENNERSSILRYIETELLVERFRSAGIANEHLHDELFNRWYVRGHRVMLRSARALGVHHLLSR